MYIRKATILDVNTFSPHEDDLAEAKAAGIDWRANLWVALECGAVALDYNGKAVALGGNNQGQCWFIIDKCLLSLPKEERINFRTAIQEHRDSLLKEYPVLWNYVWVGNRSHIRFLRSIGAVFIAEFEESPITGEPFVLFNIR